MWLVDLRRFVGSGGRGCLGGLRLLRRRLLLDCLGFGSGFGFGTVFCFFLFGFLVHVVDFVPSGLVMLWID